MNEQSADTHFAVLELRLADMEKEVKDLKEKVDATETARVVLDTKIQTASFLTKIFLTIILALTSLFFAKLALLNRLFGGGQ